MISGYFINQETKNTKKSNNNITTFPQRIIQWGTRVKISCTSSLLNSISLISGIFSFFVTLSAVEVLCS